MKYSYIVFYDEDKGDWDIIIDMSSGLASNPGAPDYEYNKDMRLLQNLRDCVPGIVPGL